MKKSVLIVGGGFAGLSAAVELVSRGHEVTLLEKQPRLGGRASSCREPITGSVLDNGSHLFMGFYKHTLDFLAKIGTDDRLIIQKNLQIDFLAPGEKIKSLRLPPLPAPWHLTAGLLRTNSLGWLDRWRALQMMKTIRSSPEGLGKLPLDKQSVTAWLGHQKQNHNLWNSMALATLHDQPTLSSAQLFVCVLQEFLLAGRKNARMILPRVGLSDLYTEAASDYITSRGGHILVKTPVLRLNFHAWEFKEVELEGGRKLEADILLLTVPFTVLRRLIPEAVLYQDTFFHALRHLQSSPILSVHLWFDRDIMDGDFAGLWGTKAQWCFNKKRIFKEEVPGHVSLTISGAREDLALPAPQIVDRSLGELKSVFPEAQGARLIHSTVIKEPEAVLAPEVGVGKWRLPQKTPYHNLFLAGDWTDTGLPASVESAVRSAKKAVELILDVP